MKHRINLIVGRTGSGKSTVAHNLCEMFPTEYSQVRSYTTRPRRNSETDHFFIKPHEVETFTPYIAAYTKIGEYEYFTITRDLDENNLYVIDPNGVADLKSRRGDDYEFFVLYLEVPEDKRIDRLRQRGDTGATIATRLGAEHDEFAAFEESGDYDIALDCTHYDKKQMVDAVKTCIEAFWKSMDEA